MHKTIKNFINQWTDEHEEFCLKLGIKCAAQQLWYWLVTNSGIGKEVEIDLIDFNQLVGKKRGEPYCNRHLKQVFAKLEELGVIKIVKQYSWHVFKLLIRPLDCLKPPKKQSFQTNTNNSTLEAEKGDESKKVENPLSQQQSYSLPTIEEVSKETKDEIRDLVNQEAGLELPEICDIYRYSIEEVQLALMLLKFQCKKKVIARRVGWLVQCLRHRYWEELENQWILENMDVILTFDTYTDLYIDDEIYPTKNAQ
ncbi:hypothetical protein CAL7716_023900 [Calothrix sp. PCC 7716]|nr:hypothetical protein CAL7716_023900 [Calothrix sp. PCC 7716]